MDTGITRKKGDYFAYLLLVSSVLIAIFLLPEAIKHVLILYTPSPTPLSMFFSNYIKCPNCGYKNKIYPKFEGNIFCKVNFFGKFKKGKIPRVRLFQRPEIRENQEKQINQKCLSDDDTPHKERILEY